MELQLTGTVKNNADGSVGIVVTGNESQLNDLVNWCKQGPTMAKVDTVTISEIVTTYFTDFSVIK